MNFNCIVYLVFTLIINQVNGERTKDKMYESISGASACFRRLNATHQTGCTSKRPGSTGVIHIIENSTDLEFVLSVGEAIPYMPVLPIDELTPSLLLKLKNHQHRIAGIIVHKNITRPAKFSNAEHCPNKKYSLSNSCDEKTPWNPSGTGILLEDYPFPIFLLQDYENLLKIQTCHEKFNNYDLKNQNARALCSLELASFMFAAINSQTCLRRSNSVTNFTPPRFCDPLGDRNVWSTLFPLTNDKDRVKDSIFVTARMDTTSLFDEVTPGAVSPLTGLVTLLQTAHLLKQMVPENATYKKNIYFILFNGESYDYIGSQRLVYDIINKKFPMEKDENIKNQIPNLNLSDIKLIVELGQLSKRKDLFTHSIQYEKDDQITTFIKKMKKHSQKAQININAPIINKNRLPPASLQSFLIENDQIEGFVLTDHNQSFTNQFYNSIYDDSDNIDYKYYNFSLNNGGVIPEDSIQRYVAGLSELLAKSLYEEAMGDEYSGELIDGANIVDELFHCYLDTANCSIFQSIALKESISEKPLSLYVGVVENGNVITSLTGFTLAWLTGDKMNVSRDNCTTDPHNPVYQYVWMSDNLTDHNSTTCFRTTMNFTLAVSPAFELEDYDWKSSKYSSWTESVWKDLYVRMYLKPSQRHEIMTISVGTATFALSLALVYFVKTRSDILFAKPEIVAPGTSC